MRTAAGLNPLVHKHELYDALVEHARDFAIIMLDPDGNVASWNVGAQRLLGYQESEILGRHFHIFFTPEDRALGRPELELVQARSRGSAEDDNWMVRKDGSLFYASGTTSSLRGEPLRGYAKIFRDLTERRCLEEEAQKRAQQLASADRYKDQFLAMLSHELRGPLAPILNALEILRLDAPASEAACKAHAILHRQLRHMTRLVDDLLDVARISQGKIALRREPVDLNAIVERAVEDTRPFIEARQHTLTVKRPQTPIRLVADPTRIEQAINNLLTNAAKYTPPGGQIALEVRCGNGRVFVSVHDSGIGIAPDLLPDVFGLFVQGERTPDRSQGGLGIGLTLVKNIVEMHGGKVSAASAGIAQGSEFTFELPMGDPEDEAEEAVAASLEPRTARILVVDDSFDTAESLAMLLTLEGYDVRTAHDGIDAVTVAREFRPEVMLLDIGLPGADGYMVAERIKSDPELREATLIAMTGYGQGQDRARSRDAGFHEHLVKPVDLDDLRALLPAAHISPRTQRIQGAASRQPEG